MGSLNFDKVFQNLGKKDDQENAKASNFAQKNLDEQKSGEEKENLEKLEALP